MIGTELQRNLAAEMARQGYHQKSLALAAGLNHTAVRDILKGRSRNPRLDTLVKIARTLATTPNDLIGFVSYPERGSADATGFAEAGPAQSGFDAPAPFDATVFRRSVEAACTNAVTRDGFAAEALARAALCVYLAAVQHMNDKASSPHEAVAEAAPKALELAKILYESELLHD